MDDKKETFVRWQRTTMQQLGFVNNLMIGLSTGLLAFQINIAFSYESAFPISFKWVFLISILLIFLSLVLGCFTAWNRLVDFRTTAQIARQKLKEKQESIKELRERTTILGKRTWLLLKLQFIFFGFGVLLLLFLAINRGMY